VDYDDAAEPIRSEAVIRLQKVFPDIPTGGCGSERNRNHAGLKCSGNLRRTDGDWNTIKRLNEGCLLWRGDANLFIGEVIEGAEFLRRPRDLKRVAVVCEELNPPLLEFLLQIGIERGESLVEF